VPYADIEGGQVHYRLDGPEGAPAIVFSNSLGTNLSMWDPQVEFLSKYYRVLRYDTRGHGLSVVTLGPYTIEQLGRDLVWLLDALRMATVSFCGLSMGGMIGMWLGVNAAERLSKLVLCNTAARIGDAGMWNARIAKVQKEGMATIADAIVQRWFTPSFIARASDRVEWTRQMLLQSPAAGYVANCAAIRDTDQRESISSIRIPTMVITGAHDPVTTTLDARFLTERISGAQYAELNAAHLSNVEASHEFNQALVGFLSNPEVR
jgi:3-oxoadipate enol-lactonase